jgi:hypothetical protein
MLTRVTHKLDTLRAQNAIIPVCAEIKAAAAFPAQIQFARRMRVCFCILRLKDIGIVEFIRTTGINRPVRSSQGNQIKLKKRHS